MHACTQHALLFPPLHRHAVFTRVSKIMCASNKCTICKQRCWDRQITVDCLICHSRTHLRCLNENSNLNTYDNYFCQVCLSSALPFQTLNNDLFNVEIDNISVHNFLSAANSKNNDFFSEDDNICPDKYMPNDDVISL